MIILSKGANTALSVSDVVVTVRWSGAQEVDASALLVGPDGKVASDDDFVFYNQPEAAGGAVRHLGGTGEQRLRVRLAALPGPVERVVLSASVYQGTFGAVTGLELLVNDASGNPLVHYPVEGAASETVLVLGELYRRSGQWKVRAIGQGYDTGLAGLATDYGVTVDDAPEDDAPAQTPQPVPPQATVPMPLPAPPQPSTGYPAPPPQVTAPMPVPAPPPAGYPAPPQPPAVYPAPPPPPAGYPAPSQPPAGYPGAAPSPADETFLPVDMRQRISLRKQAVGVALQKKGLTGIRARVALVLDASGSMAGLYGRGTVGRVVERMAPVAAQLDSNATLDSWIFASGFARLPGLRIPELPAWLSAHVPSRLPARITTDPSGRPVSRLSLRRNRFRSLGYGNDEPRVMADVIDHYRSEPTGEPTLVLFFSDGGVYLDDAITLLLHESSTLPIFWQFVGLGRADYGILEDLDTLPGRTVDNAGFFSVDDIDRLSDEELYERLLTEFPRWIQAARNVGILR